MKSQFFPNKVVWWLGLAIRLNREFKPRANGLASLRLLSCSATTGMTLQLPCMLHTCANFGSLPVTSHSRVQSRVSASLHNLEHFFTLSHSLPLHDSHLNTGLLIAKYKQIWYGIKPTRWLIKFNLTTATALTSTAFIATISFSISHSLPLHDSHLNTGLLIAKIQVNLAWK